MGPPKQAKKAVLQNFTVAVLTALGGCFLKQVQVLPAV